MNTLDTELAELKQNKSRIWFNYDTGTVGVIFVKLLPCFTKLIDVHRIMDYIIKVIQEGEDDHNISTRFICRMLPIDFLCKASGN